MPAVARIVNPRSLSRFNGKIDARLSRLARETKAVPEVGRPPEAASWDLANAMPKVSSMPMTSPVERISGPRMVSTPWKRPNGSTASLTDTAQPDGMVPPSPTTGRMPISRRDAMLSPIMTRAAALATCTAVALETKGTVRDARGLASST